MAKNEPITYREVFEIVEKINERLGKIEIKLANIEGQKSMGTFLISLAVGVFFSVINIVLLFVPKR